MKWLFIILIPYFTNFSVHLLSQVDEILIARNTGEQTLWDGTDLKIMGYAKTVGDSITLPSPTLIFNEGDNVIIDLYNLSQGAPHTIHLHGLDVDQENDGVPALSYAVEHLEHGYYSFIAPHPGLYLYHCHVISVIHLQAGMYGMIQINPSTDERVTWIGGHSYDSDQNWLFSEVDTVWHTTEVFDSMQETNGATVAIPEYHPQYYLINGKTETELEEESSKIQLIEDEIRFQRIGNMGYYGTRILFPEEINVKIVSSDGRPLPEIEVNNEVEIFPGERYGVLLQSYLPYSGFIEVQYFDLNTLQVKNSQFVEIAVSQSSSIQPNLDDLNINLFPNPVQENLVIQNDYFSIQDWMILDLDGKIVLSNQKLISNTISVADLNSGIYLFRCLLKDGGSQQKKFFKN